MSFPAYGAPAGASSGSATGASSGGAGAATGGMSSGGGGQVIPLRPGQAASSGQPTGAGVDQAGQMLQQTLAQMQQMQQQASQQEQRYQQLFGQHQAQQQVLDRLRGAFAPEAAAPDPAAETAREISETERILEYYIAQGFEHEKAGNPIPLTIDSSIRQLQDRMRFLKSLDELRTKNGQLENAVRALADEGFQLDRNAQSVLGTSLMGAIETIYGPGQQNLPQKRAMWGAVQGLMGQELKALKESQPQQWDRIRRDPMKLAKLANYFVEQTIPPRARELLQMQQIQSTPLSEGDLWQAFNEARQIQDPRQREQLTTKIRQDILAHRFSRSGARGADAQPQRPNLASLYGRGGNPAPQGQRAGGFRLGAGA